ncbi:MAG TPA: ankyrin repeat domain-containing protein [Longimicrobiales bacterium]
MSTTETVELELDRLAPPTEPVRFEHSPHTLLIARIAAGILALPFVILLFTGTRGLAGFASLVLAACGGLLLWHVHRRIAARPSIVVAPEGLSVVSAGATKLAWSEVVSIRHDRVRRLVMVGTRANPGALTFDDDLADFGTFLDVTAAHLDGSRRDGEPPRRPPGNAMFRRPFREDLVTLSLSLAGLVGGLMGRPVLFALTALALPRLLWHWLNAPSSVLVDDTAVWIIRPLARDVIPLRAIDDVWLGVGGRPEDIAVMIDHRDRGTIEIAGLDADTIPLFDAVIAAGYRAREASRGMAVPVPRAASTAPQRKQARKGGLRRTLIVLAAFIAIGWASLLTGVPLRTATRYGADLVARIAILLGAPIDAADGQGFTALHHAALYDRIDIARALVGHGADVNAQSTPDGLAPLHYAAERGYHGIVQVLLDAGADADLRTSAGRTPLAHAALEFASGDADIARMLVDAGANPDVADAAGRTPVHHAAAAGHAALLRRIAGRADADAPDTLGLRPLHLALMAGHREALEALLDAGADPNATGRDGRNALAYAATASVAVPILNTLIDAGARADTHDDEGWNAVQLATARNNLEFLQVAARRRLPLNATDGRVPPALWIAARESHTDAARILLRGGANPRIGWEGTTAMELAYQKRNATMVALMQMR